ncbi:MAG TPA: hypothetical protein VFB54_06360 [Burkholderiales bacterium]|nr:hypothetical protein [Burkholderiales bacterium]
MSRALAGLDDLRRVGAALAEVLCSPDTVPATGIDTVPGASVASATPASTGAIATDTMLLVFTNSRRSMSSSQKCKAG